MKKSLVMLVFTVCMSTALFGGNYSSASYLLINTYPQYEAMGKSTGASFYGVASAAENPATIAGVENFEFAAMQNMWLFDVASQKLSAAKYFGFGNIGFELSNIDLGSVDVLSIDAFNAPVDGDEILNLTARSGTLLYAKKIKNFALGAGLKLIYENFGKEEYYFGVDVGFIYKEFLMDEMDFAVSVLNISKEEDGFTIPLNLNAAVSYYIEANGESVMRLALAANYLKPDDVIKVYAGFDYDMFSTVHLRGGINMDNDGKLNFSAGAGFKYEGIKINYAYVPNGVLGDVHKISIEGAIPKGRDEEEEEISTKGDSYEEYKKSGDYYYGEKKYKRALKYYEYLNLLHWREVEKLSNPNKTALFQKIGICYYNIRDNKRAREYFNRALLYDKKNEILKHWIRLIK